MAKRRLDGKREAGLHAFAAAACPHLRDVPPRTLVRGMVVAETATAGSLLVPVVPATVGAAGPAAFGTGLVGTYLRVPGLRRARRAERGRGQLRVRTIR
jgi:hypothetical protein